MKYKFRKGKLVKTKDFLGYPFGGLSGKVIARLKAAFGVPDKKDCNHYQVLLEESPGCGLRRIWYTEDELE